MVILLPWCDFPLPDVTFCIAAVPWGWCDFSRLMWLKHGARIRVIDNVSRSSGCVQTTLSMAWSIPGVWSGGEDVCVVDEDTAGRGDRQPPGLQCTQWPRLIRRKVHHFRKKPWVYTHCWALNQEVLGSSWHGMETEISQGSAFGILLCWRLVMQLPRITERRRRSCWLTNCAMT